MKLVNIFNAVIYISGAVMVIGGIIGRSKSDDIFFFIETCTGLILMILAIIMSKINEITVHTNATPTAE